MIDTLKEETWKTDSAAELYNLEGWGRGFFSIAADGQMEVLPAGADGPAIGLKDLVDSVRRRGIELPLLIRFSEILKARLESIHSAFQRAISEYGYKGRYQGVYPIKVNQDRYLVERLVEFGRPFHFGLEAGSKPELLAVIAMMEDDEGLVICNGYKDAEYIETGLLASKLGRRVILVVEKPSELELIQKVSVATGVRPRLGIRARLASRGSGHWQESGGARSKFGLSGSELLEAMAFLQRESMLDCFELLHFHIGSQVSSIRAVQDALREATRIYANLAKMGAPLRYLDVGGGLGIDYDGNQSKLASSMNYTLEEYANDIVAGVLEICDLEGVEHPTLVSESGRATVAHHAVLVVEVLDVAERWGSRPPDDLPPDAAPTVKRLAETCREIHSDNLLESYHDATAARDECVLLFTLGHLSLEQRGLAEDLFWLACRRIYLECQQLEEVPEELDALERLFADTYFCNFSLFQSLPDSWAIDQLFPIMPIHRLNTQPTRRGVLADITCDSDGKIDRFISRKTVKRALELHPYERGSDYHLGIFLVGAYQEILGDLHNLFGDTNTVSVSLDPKEGYRIDEVDTGDSVTEVLEYVSYEKRDLLARLRRASESALRAKRMTIEDSRQLMKVFEEGLNGYTYLEG